LRNPEPAQVAIIASQAAQYSALAEFQIAAQRKAARALAHYARLTPYLIYENQIENMEGLKLAILPSAQALTEKAWQQLLQYVEGGGNLLITGPIDRDEHWQNVDRASALVPGAAVAPLTFHNALQSLKDTAQPAIPLSFGQEAQSWVEVQQFGDRANYQELKRGNGRIFWASYPVELAEGESAAGELYAAVAGELAMQPQFETRPLLPGIMAYALSLDDSVLYIFVSDSARDSAVSLRDKATGVPLSFTLPAEHAAMALISRKEKTVIAKYGF
jgi:hypothetical protein